MRGIGTGTLAVIIFIFVGIIICFFRNCTAVPNVMVIIGFAIPIIVFLIILGMPKSSNSSQQSNLTLPTDYYMRKEVFYISIIAIVLFGLLCLLLG